MNDTIMGSRIPDEEQNEGIAPPSTGDEQGYEPDDDAGVDDDEEEWEEG